MEGKTVILTVFGIFAVAVVGTIAAFFGRIVWAMRNPEKFKEFERRKAQAAAARRDAESERIRAGKPSWTGRIFGAAFLLVGVLIIALSARQFYEIGRGQSWTETHCTILRSSVVSKISARSATTYLAKIEYSYAFDGREFTGNRLDLPNNAYSSRDAAENALSDYPAGAKVDCYVNAENPQESVLDRSFLRFPLFRNGAGMFLCLGLSGYLFYASRRRKPKSPDVN